MALDKIIWGDPDDSATFESPKELMDYLKKNLHKYKLEIFDIEEFEDRFEFKMKYNNSIFNITNFRNKEFVYDIYNLNNKEIGNGFAWGYEGLEPVLYNH